MLTLLSPGPVFGVTGPQGCEGRPVQSQRSSSLTHVHTYVCLLCEYVSVYIHSLYLYCHFRFMSTFVIHKKVSTQTEIHGRKCRSANSYECEHTHISLAYYPPTPLFRQSRQRGSCWSKAGAARRCRHEPAESKEASRLFWV